MEVSSGALQISEYHTFPLLRTLFTQLPHLLWVHVPCLPLCISKAVAANHQKDRRTEYKDVLRALGESTTCRVEWIAACNGTPERTFCIRHQKGFRRAHGTVERVWVVWNDEAQCWHVSVSWFALLFVQLWFIKITSDADACVSRDETRSA